MVSKSKNFTLKHCIGQWLLMIYDKRDGALKYLKNDILPFQVLCWCILFTHFQVVLSVIHTTEYFVWDRSQNHQAQIKDISATKSGTSFYIQTYLIGWLFKILSDVDNECWFMLVLIDYLTEVNFVPRGLSKGMHKGILTCMWLRWKNIWQQMCLRKCGYFSLNIHIHMYFRKLHYVIIF